MSDYVFEEVPADEIARQRDLYGPLAQSVRELADAVIRTEADDDEIRIAQAEIEAAVRYVASGDAVRAAETATGPLQ